MVVTIKSGIVQLLLEMLLLGNCTDWISKLSTRKPKLVSTQCRFECNGIQVYNFLTFYLAQHCSALALKVFTMVNCSLLQ